MPWMPDPIATTPRAVGQAVRRLRHERGMTQKELAEACVMRQATLSALENGAAGTRLDTLFRVLTVLEQAVVLADRGRLLADRGGDGVALFGASER